MKGEFKEYMKAHPDEWARILHWSEALNDLNKSEGIFAGEVKSPFGHDNGFLFYVQATAVMYGIKLIGRLHRGVNASDCYKYKTTDNQGFFETAHWEPNFGFAVTYKTVEDFFIPENSVTPEYAFDVFDNHGFDTLCRAASIDEAFERLIEHLFDRIEKTNLIACMLLSHKS